jgi:formimidoylglutamate deiminase
MNTLYLPKLLYSDGRFHSNAGVLVGGDGKILEVPAKRGAIADKVIEMPGRALLPGFVNAHSHSFQRLIRGRSESRVTSGRDFWSWRGTMYHAAAQLAPQDVYDAARMAFLEMVLAGTTTVGEFHYLHTAPDGTPYDDQNLLGKQVIAAAQSVGIRIVLLRAAYFRSGYELPPDPGQTRFFESPRAFLENMDALVGAYPADSEGVSFGVAPHSIRAVPFSDFREIAAYARHKRLPIHMHMAEQVAENAACVKEYGLTPVALLGTEKLLGPDFTAVHAIHTDADEIAMLAEFAAGICACPTTERNLGDGILAADRVMQANIRVALGSDSQAQIDPLEDARELDYHLRLQQQQRAVLDQIHGQPIAERLFDCATIHGASVLAVPAGCLARNSYADFFTVDLDDPSIAGNAAADFLPLLVFSLDRSAIRDVVVHGKQIVCGQKHALQEEIIARYGELHQRVWLGAGR